MNHLCIRFINSNSPWYGIHCNYADALLDKEWMRCFIKDAGFPEELLDTDIPFELLNSLRTLLAGSLDCITHGNGLPQENLDQLNSIFAKSVMVYEAKRQGDRLELSFTANKKDWDYVISDIAASFIKMISELNLSRLKRCENPDCKSVFYDSSKNQTRKWCCNSCSSLIKVRRHRAKNNIE